jgi:hypothetical protein
MNKGYVISRALASLLAIGAGAKQSEAQGVVLSEVNLSAANCIPRSAGAFDGSGASGFRWDDGGAFVNTDDDDNEDLFCAVPYDPSLRRANGTIPTVEVRVNVIDHHDGDEVRVDGYHQKYVPRADGTTAIVTDRFGSANTDNLGTGRSTLTVSLAPADTTTRYIWVRINVPDSDNVGLSGVAGYRVRRF